MASKPQAENTILALDVQMSLGYQNGMDTPLKAAREAAGLTQAQLAERVGSSQPQILRLENSKRKLTKEWAQRLAPALATTPEILIFGQGDGQQRRLPVVGWVGAGAVYAPFEPHEVERIEAPEWANDNTVAAIIRGDSLGELFDHWLVYYDRVEARPTSSMLNKLCVVGLADGRIMVKKIRKGQLAGHFNLFSNTEPPIYDAIVEWCAVVRNMSPR